MRLTSVGGNAAMALLLFTGPVSALESSGGETSEAELKPENGSEGALGVPSTDSTEGDVASGDTDSGETGAPSTATVSGSESAEPAPPAVFSLGDDCRHPFRFYQQRR